MVRVERAWTEDEDNVLVYLWPKNTPSAEVIGKMMGRSRFSVMARAQRLGLPCRDGTPRIVEMRPFGPAVPVSRAMRELARFDPIIARCVQMREMGL